MGLAPALVSGQVALCLVLLVGAGLLTRSLLNLRDQDLGFDRNQLLLARLETRLAGYKAPELEGLYRRLLDRVRAVPGVTAATIATYSPLGNMSRSNTVTVEGYTPREGEQMSARVDLVGPSYPETMGMSLKAGRPIAESDRIGAPRAAMINESFAKAYFGQANPLGRRLGFGALDSSAYEVVGVVRDARFDGVAEASDRMVFLPLLQSAGEEAFTSELAVRVSGDPAAAGPLLREAVSSVDPHLPISGLITLGRQVDDSLSQHRLFARLVAVFGGLAVLLACVGLYGVVSQSVARRANEVGIRMALGAEGTTIVGMVLRETMLLIGSGLVIGVPAALAAGRVIRGQLFGVGTADPATIAGTSLLLLVVALVAGFIPARRAASLSPMTALRQE